MKQKTIERNALIVSVFTNCIMTAAGLWVFLQTEIQALFLDFAFSFIAVMSAISAVIISYISQKKTKHYPNGLYFLEPLYAIFKSLLTLVLLTISVVGTAISAYNYFSRGEGEIMKIGPVFPYAIAMVILCFSLGLFNRRQNKKINGVSTILKAESKSNFIDGLLSLGVGAAIVPLSLISVDGQLGFLHYTGDFFITAILVLVSVKEPLTVLSESFRELSGGTTSDNTIRNKIIEVIDKNFSAEKKYKCHIFKVGMLIKVQIQIKASDIQKMNISCLKERITEELCRNYENVKLDIVLI